MTCRQRDVAHLNGRFRLGAASQMIEFRQAENDPKQAFDRIRLYLHVLPQMSATWFSSATIGG